MKISEFIEELQGILEVNGDLEIYEEILDGEESTGIWYVVNPVPRSREDVKINKEYNDLPDKFVSLE